MTLQKVLSRVRQAVADYHMIEEGDRIAVGISGGKDSLTLLLALYELSKFYPKHFTVIAVTVNLGFQNLNLNEIRTLCADRNIPYTVVETSIAQIVFEDRKEDNPCSLCAKMRKGALNDAIKELGCNKIALGHHFDDVIETILMGILYGGQINTMMPKLHSTNFQGMELIRPLYYVKEEDILAWKDYNSLHFLQCACRFTERIAKEQAARGMAGEAADIVHTSKRQEMKELIRSLRKTSPFIDANIMKSVENINLDACLGYVKDGVRRHFMDEYDER